MIRRWDGHPTELALLLALALTAAGSPTFAQQIFEPQDVSAERFQLSTDREGILSVEGAAVTPHLAIDTSVWFGHSDDPIALYRTVAAERMRLGALVQNRLGGELIVSLGLFDALQVGVTLPFVLSQNRPGAIDGVVGELPGLASSGIGSVRFVPKLRLLNQKAHQVDFTVIASIAMPPASGAGYFGNADLVFAPALAAGRRFGVVRLALNAGYRLRKPARLVSLVIDDELYARVGASFDLGRSSSTPISLQIAFATATAAKDPYSASNLTYAEIMGGASVEILDLLIPFVGAGYGLGRAAGTPDWRVFAGLRFSPRANESDPDGDGIGFGDECPTVPEDKDGFADQDGCPDPDNDDDGADDATDRCPDVPGDPDNGGCPNIDSDQDGVSDGADECPMVPEDLDEFEDSDGCPEADNDEDEVPDTADACPLEPGVPENRGCPDADRDGDGVIDRLDNCPEQAGSAANRGCRRKQLVKIVDDKLELLDRVNFESGSEDIRKSSYRLLNNVVRVLKAHPEFKSVIIEGHTDNRGDPAENKTLSESRADAVMFYLVQAGVDSERLRARGFGAEKPVASNDTPEGRAKNRRVAFLIQTKK